MNEMNNIINNCQLSIGKVGEVLTLQLHDVILKFISITKTAKIEISATKEKEVKIISTITFHLSLLTLTWFQI